jgi:hypothetical protein
MARTTEHDWEALAFKYAGKAADTAEGLPGTNDKAVRFATLAQAFATVAMMERAGQP